MQGPNDGSYIYKQLSFHYYVLLGGSVNGTHDYDNSHDGHSFQQQTNVTCIHYDIDVLKM